MVCNTLIALDDFTKENGGTTVIPGSHVWGAKRRPRRAEAQHLEMPAGSLFIFDGGLFHAGGGNTTRDQIRRTICLNYTPDWLRPIENHTLSVPFEVALKLPKPLQADLGYYNGRTGLGSVDLEHPIEYLQRQAKL